MRFSLFNMSLLNAAISSWLFHAYSIWLFTLSDLKTIVVPKTTFGILNALAFVAISTPDANGQRPLEQSEVFVRLPLVVLWVWINLLPFAIDNQRQPEAILEDKYNKPWRTMPSGRMTGEQATVLMFALYPVAFCVSLKTGGTRQCLALMILGYGYNDLNLADWSWISRNAINGAGFCCFASGALEVALDAKLSKDHRVILEWLGIIAAVVFSTVQTQDMGDQDGDRMRGRKSLPLSIGDGPARWATAAPMIGWSIFCPLYWGLGVVPRLVLGFLGLTIACRTLMLRDVEADKRTFRIWNAWMACLYTLPLLATL